MGDLPAPYEGNIRVRVWDGITMNDLCKTFGLEDPPKVPISETEETTYDTETGDLTKYVHRKVFSLYEGMLIITTESGRSARFACNDELVTEVCLDLIKARTSGVLNRKLKVKPLSEFLSAHGIEVSFGPRVSVRWRLMDRQRLESGRFIRDIFELPGRADITVEPSTCVRADKIKIRPLFLQRKIERIKTEQAGAGEPATAPESKPSDDLNPNSESKPRPQ